jgi:hypothetical protein
LEDRSVPEIHLINWTIEEAKLLKAERPRPSDVNPIPSLDQLLVWPDDDPPGQATEPADSVARSTPIQSTAETAPVMPPSNDAVAAPKPKTASYSPGASSGSAVWGSVSISAEVRTEESKSPLPTAIIKPDIDAAPLDRDRMIALRWVLRDIRSNRLKWWPIDQHDLRTLIEMGFVERRDGIAVLTSRGDRAID